MSAERWAIRFEMDVEPTVEDSAATQVMNHATNLNVWLNENGLFPDSVQVTKVRSSDGYRTRGPR